MKDNLAFLDAVQQIAKDKGISVDVLLDALANVLVAAYKRMPGAAEEAVVTVEPDSGDIRVYGQELDEDGNVVREWDDTPKDFGRIAAETAKQVIFQRIPVKRSATSSTRSTPAVRATSSPASSSRATTGTPSSTSARSKHCCRRPSRSRSSTTSTTPG